MNSAVKPDISVLIPAYNGARWLPETLNRLPAAAGDAPFETIVVDNASTDETIEAVRKAAGVQIVRNEKNLGFSRAVNQAAAASRGKVLVAINQDLYLQPNALKSLSEFISSKNVVAGGALAFQDGTAQPSFGPFPTLIGTIYRLALPRRIRKYDLGPASGETRPVDWVTGAFIGFPRAVFDKIGGFDENYFMYYEDVDFCLRASQAGFPSYFVPSAQAVHVAPYSDRGESPDWLKQVVRRSQMTFFKKHRPACEASAIRALNRAYFAVHGWPWP
ncbi:MAG: glycosyltransferase family 2 protein [Elusimicrobiota bacterium]